MKNSGQIVIPGLALLIVSIFLFIGFIHWSTRTLWQMRMNLAADAAALSAARSQAEMLNTISDLNVGINLYLIKARIPLTHKQVGGIPAEKLSGFRNWNSLLKTTVNGFKAFPAGVGETVARANGAEGYSPYFPFPMPHYLEPIPFRAAILIKSPPFIVGTENCEPAYYARSWSPTYIKAQPPHKTTWLVKRAHTRAMATARLWLDLRPGSIENNGGFPRKDENWFRDLLIQGFWPQFNAQLINLNADQTQSLWARLIGTT